MRRYWVDKKFIQDNQVFFEDEVFHHIFDVCRQDVGSQFEVLGDGDKAHFVKVTAVGKKTAQAQILETRHLPPLRDPKIVLCLSVPRFPVFDAVIEKAVEMGVARIQPFFSEYSFVRSLSKYPSGKSERWEKIIRSATQQSGRGDLMSLDHPLNLEDLLTKFNQTPGLQGLFAYEGKATRGIKEHLQQSQAESSSEVWIFVGSEGGFSSTEVELLQQKGLVPVTLGDQVLRVETACITLVAILKYHLGHCG